MNDLEALLHGPDRKDMQRFHAAAGVVLQGEKLNKDVTANKGKIQSSAACSIQ